MCFTCVSLFIQIWLCGLSIADVDNMQIEQQVGNDWFQTFKIRIHCDECNETNEANRNERRTSMRTHTYRDTNTNTDMDMDTVNAAPRPQTVAWWRCNCDCCVLRSLRNCFLFLGLFGIFRLRSTLWFAVDFLRTSSSCNSVRLRFRVVNTTCVWYTWQPFLAAAWGTTEMT